MWSLEGASGGRGDDGSFKDRMKARGNERLPVTTVLVAGVVEVEEFQRNAGFGEPLVIGRWL